jgi:hypothetical protein
MTPDNLRDVLAEALAVHTYVIDGPPHYPSTTPCGFRCPCGARKQTSSPEAADLAARQHVADAVLPTVERLIADARGEKRPWRPEDGDSRCQKCGAENWPWYVPDDLWNGVVGTEDNPRGEGTILCVTCFVLHARAEQAAADRERIEAMLPAECWVSRSDAVFCIGFVGGKFPNGAEFTADAVCLPCRLRAALDSEGGA